MSQNNFEKLQLYQWSERSADKVRNIVIHRKNFAKDTIDRFLGEE